MFFTFKTKKEKLQKRRKNLLEQAYQWSSIDRKKSDAYYAEADAIDEQLKEV
mgnify:CR=1 FL=1